MSAAKRIGQPFDRRRTQGERETFDQWCLELKRRLRNVSGSFAAGELDALVARMTRVRRKYLFSAGVPET